MSRSSLVLLGVLGVLAAAPGCARPAPLGGAGQASVNPKSVAGQLLARPPVAEVATKDLAPRAAEDAGVAKIALSDKAACEEELRERQLAKWRSRLFWASVIFAVLAVVAFLLLLRFVGAKWAWRAAGVFGALAALCPVIGWILGHVVLTLLVLAALAAAAIALKVLGRWRELVDGAQILWKKTAGVPEVQALAEAGVHNADSFAAWASKLVGGPPAP